MRLASRTSAGGSPFRFDDADAAVFIVYLVICTAHLVYALSLIGSAFVKCIQRVSGGGGSFALILKYYPLVQSSVANDSNKRFVTLYSL